MNLHWYGWVGLIFTLFFACLETGCLIYNARNLLYHPKHVLYIGLWWTAAIAIAISGASP